MPGLIDEIATVVIIILIWVITIKYSDGLKRAVKTFLYAGVISLITFWLIDLLIQLPIIVFPILILFYIILNVLFHREEDESED